MLWIFVLALIMPISLGSCDDANLAKVTWDHAVNSQAKLKAALDNDGVQMIEADVVLGELETSAPQTNPADGSKPAESVQPKAADKDDVKKAAEAAPDTAGSSDGAVVQAATKIPIMAHPPAVKSDLSLKQFLDTVAAHNKDVKDGKPVKGVKLDFKSIEAAKEALTSWDKNDANLKTVWLNADIVTGPGKTDGDQVDAKQFFAAVLAATGLVNQTLSIGWTTDLGKDKLNYTQEHVDAMVSALEDGKIPAGYPVTFPVRAALAAESKETLHNLYEKVSKVRETTFTIWSGNNDTVDAAKLQEFINKFGVTKVYVDVPSDLHSKLNLSGDASTIVKFGLLNLAAIAFAMFFRNGLH